MKIIQLLPKLNEGGVERGVVDLNREFVKAGIENIVISSGGKLVEQIKQDGGEHINFDVSSKNIFTVPFRVFKLRKLLKKLNPDIIHVRSRVPAWLLYFANKNLNFKIVSTVHGFNSISKYSAIMTKANRVICGSKFMIKHIINHYQTPIDIIELIPRGMDLEYFNENNLDENFIGEIKKKYNLEDKFVIVQVARITHWKDQETTIKAFNLLKKEFQDIKLLLVGGYETTRESYYSKLNDLVKSLNLEQDIIFLGNTKYVKEIFHIANLNISSSYKPETFGRANVEGMLLGIPLVGTNIGATSDYIIENETGLFFDPKNEIMLYEKIKEAKGKNFDKEFIKNFAKENFSLSNMVEKNIEVYKKCIKEKFI